MAKAVIKRKEPINLGDTSKLSNAEWLKWREHGPYYDNPANPLYIPVTVGGSFVSTIFGLNPWVSYLEGFHKKSGITPAITTDEDNAEAKKAGHIYEPYVADSFVRYMAEVEHKEVKMWDDTNMYQHPEERYEFALANIDRRIRVDGEEGILECKTTNPYNAEDWADGKCPIYYELQCRFYMEVLDLDFCYIICCWGFKDSERAVVRLNRDRTFGHEILEKCLKFVSDVISGNEPTKAELEDIQVKSETLLQYYVRYYGVEDIAKDPVNLDDLPESEEYRNLITEDLSYSDEITRLKNEIKELEKKRLDICTKLYPILVDSKKGVINTDEGLIDIKLSIPMHRAKFDEDVFRDMEPEAWNKYKKEVIDIDALTKADPELKAAYTIPATPNTTTKGKTPTLELKRKAK